MPDFQQRVFVRLTDGKLVQELRVMGAGVIGGGLLAFLARLPKGLLAKQLAADIFGSGFGVAQTAAGQPLQFPGAGEGILVLFVHLTRGLESQKRGVL